LIETVFKELLLEFVALENERLALEDRKKVILARISEIQRPLVEHFTEYTIDQLHAGNRTIKPERKLWAVVKDKDNKRAIAALQASGLGEFVNEGFNVSSLSAHFRALEDVLRPGEILHLPPLLDEAFELVPETKLVSRALPGRRKAVTN